MKKCVFMFLFFTSVFGVIAQTRFDRIDSIPVSVGGNNLRFPWVGGINFPCINSIDLNNDGLMDMLIFDRYNNRVITFLNNGSTDYNLAWDSTHVYDHLLPPLSKWAYTYDYNCDGKMDIFTLANNPSGISVYMNDYNNGLQWTNVDTFLLETFASLTQNVFANSVSIPAFADIDNDGDMDILGYNTLPDGRISWHKNYSMEDYGRCDSLDFKLETACWGNFTLRIGGSNSVSCFGCPCRMAGPSSQNTDKNLGGYTPEDAARRDDTISGICVIDVNGDGAKELLVGDIASRNSLLINNGGTLSQADMITQDVSFPSYDTPADFSGFHNHTYIDVDNDGKRDLIVSSNQSENKNGMWLYKNVGTDASPIFHFEITNFLQSQMIDQGESASPVLFDYDGDGLQDMVIGSTIFVDSVNALKSVLTLYKNIGTATSPSFQFVTGDYAGLSSQNYLFLLYPAFGDIDGDGDLDMFIGTDAGNVNLFTNTAGPGNVANFQAVPGNYMGIDVGNYATPQIFDLNKDGLLDIIAGEKNGFIDYYQNTGTTTNAFFNSVPTNDTLGCIVIQGTGTTDGYTIPFLYDSLGKTRMMVASELGSVVQYEDINVNINGCYTNKGSVIPIVSNRIKQNVTVSGGDLNGDGLTDLLVGQATGGVNVYYQFNPTVGIGSLSEVKPSLLIYPNPAVDELKIHFYNLKSGGASVRIFDALGKTILERTLDTDELRLVISDWSAGMYMLQFNSGSYSITRKITVSK